MQSHRKMVASNHHAPIEVKPMGGITGNAGVEMKLLALLGFGEVNEPLK